MTSHTGRRQDTYPAIEKDLLAGVPEETIVDSLEDVGISTERALRMIHVMRAALLRGVNAERLIDAQSDSSVGEMWIGGIMGFVGLITCLSNLSPVMYWGLGVAGAARLVRGFVNWLDTSRGLWELPVNFDTGEWSARDAVRGNGIGSHGTDCSHGSGPDSQDSCPEKTFGSECVEQEGLSGSDRQGMPVSCEVCGGPLRSPTEICGRCDEE